MNSKKAIGLVLGITCFGLAIATPIDGLELSGRIALGLFSLAAVFWILEPIPIFATSVLVIFLQVMMLSQEGFVFSPRFAPSEIVERSAIGGSDGYPVPTSYFGDEGALYLKTEAGKVVAVRELAIIEAEESISWVSVESLPESPRIVSDPNHRSIVAEANAYSKFYATLASPIIILFLGGFALAAAAVKFGLDRALTRILLKPFGSDPKFVCLGLMLCAGGLSAFMSNTATTAMMMTVVLPIAGSLAVDDPFRKGVALAIPVAANIGGIATPIGTPPNAVALAALKGYGINLSFSTWMLAAAPFSIALLILAWLVIMRLFKPRVKQFEVDIKSSFRMTLPAMFACIIFGITVLLWMTEKLHGLSTSMVAFLPVAAMPALGVLDKKDIRGFSWEVLWLVAGGISLGLSMKDTGLAQWMIGLVSWELFGGIAVIALFAVVGFALSNLISNTVAATMLMPLVLTVGASLAEKGAFNLVSAIVAITTALSCAMILPISTPPNAIAMSVGILDTKDMARVGAIVGLSGIALAIVSAIVYWPFVLG